MLNKRASDFTILVLNTAAMVGNNAGRIAEAIIRQAFPRTSAEADAEGADKALRIGVISEVKRVLRRSLDDADQIAFSDIDPAFRPIVQRLKSKTYFVESIEEYVLVSRLIGEPHLLDEAQKFMHRKGQECLAEADTLRELHRAVIARGTAA